MRKPEWIEVVQLLRVNWPHATIPDGSIAKWYVDLEHLPAEQVRVAVETLYRDGREYPPNGAQILAKVSELDRDDPDFGEVWRLVKKAGLKFGWHPSHSPAEAVAWLEEQSPAAAEVVRQFTPSSLMYQLDDEPTVRAQFRDVYKAVCVRRKRDDAYARLPSAGLRGLERGPRHLGAAIQKALPERSGDAA